MPSSRAAARTRAIRPMAANDDDLLLPNEPTCVAACAGGGARFWRSTSRFGDWTAMGHLDNPDASQSEQSLVSDRPGRSFDSFGAGRHAMEPREAAQATELKRFAKQVAGYLDKAVSSGEVSRLVLVCDPGFLGALRQELSPRASAASAASACARASAKRRTITVLMSPSRRSMRSI